MKTDGQPIATIVALANTTFKDPDKAMRWLQTPQNRFGERSPLNIANTEQGARLVEEALGQLDEGYFC